MQLSSFALGLMIVVADAGHAKSADAKSAKPTQAVVNQIRKECGITSDQFTYDDQKISFRYDGMIEDQKVDCARDKTAILGVGFESYDLTAPYSGPRRFLIKGPSKRLEAVAVEASALNWVVKEQAKAKDGIGFLELEAGVNFTRRDVSAFLDRFKRDLSDIAVGLAPFSLAGYDIPDTSTDFRLSARQMYDRLGTPSCGAPREFDRETLLRPDRDAVSQLERELSLTSAGAHLSIAREDAALELLKKPESCWADHDIRFAKLHVEMIHNSVTALSSRLRNLAPTLDPPPATQAPANAPEIRYQVRQLTIWMHPLCSWTTKGTNEQIFAPSWAEVRKLQEHLKGTAYEAQFAIARGDATYERSRVTAECDDPDNDPVSKLSAQALSTTKKHIDLINALVSP